MSAAGATAEGLTKSAKKRMAQKAKVAAAEEAVVEEAPAAPAPKAKGKAKAKAQAEAPAAKAAAAPKAAAGAAKAAPKAAAEPAAAKAKAKADPKAAAKAEAAPKAGAKAAAKAAADPKAKAKAEAKADAKAPAPAAKADAKAKAKGKAKAAKPEEAAVPKEELPINVFLDDGSGGAWETTGAVSKKKEKKVKDKGDGKEGEKPAAAASSGAAYGGGKAGGKGGKADQTGYRAKVVEGAAAEVARILAMKAPEVEGKPQVVQAAHIESQIVPEEKIGIVIGPKGTTIQLIQEKCKVSRIDTMGGVFTISGDEENVKEAKKAIQDIIEKGFCTLNYDDFAEGFVNANPMYFPDIIGSKGAIIRAIKENLKVEVNIPQTPKDYKPTDKFKIKLAGNAKQVEEAKEVINAIMQYQHHEITHPGQTHEELELEQWAYSFIIGRGGSEMKHIQNNFSVKVVIPRENSQNKNVLVVGQPKDAERAKAYIEKVIYEAETKQKKDPREDKPADSGDKWGDDDPVEPGCEGYVIKRG